MRLALVFLIGFATKTVGQASPYLVIDHPASALVEWLIARGEIRDPSPQLRPLRQADVLAALDEARIDPVTASGRLVANVRAMLEREPDDSWFRIEPRGGFQSFTSARRDLLHPAGDGGIRGYVEMPIEARFGALVGASRPIAENRLKLDPDWSGGSLQRTKNQAYRFAEGYLSAQFKFVRAFFGQMERNWGPTGSLGLSIANYGYPRTDLAVELGFRDIQIQLLGASLPAMVSTTGETHRRYFLAHRLNARVLEHLDLAIWETMVVSGTAESVGTGNTFNPLVLFSFPIQFGQPDDRNTIIGGDLTWRVSPGLRIQGQAMIDDRWRAKSDSVTGEPRHPGRWAMTLAGAGGLGRSLAWRGAVSIVSSLAYRTSDSAKSFLDRGIGIGPHFTDLIRVDARVEVPIHGRWLVAPELAMLHQGEGRIDGPFPVGAALTATPELLVGRVSRTIRIGASVVGTARGLTVVGAGGWQRTTSADHIAGRVRTGFEARLQATIGTAYSGVLH